jgi:hypothetical protein
LKSTGAAEDTMAKKSLEQTVETEVSALSEDLSVRIKDAIENARDWREVAESYIKKSPGLCLAGAFVLGFVISKVARHA